MTWHCKIPVVLLSWSMGLSDNPEIAIHNTIYAPSRTSEQFTLKIFLHDLDILQNHSGSAKEPPFYVLFRKTLEGSRSLRSLRNDQVANA